MIRDLSFNLPSSITVFYPAVWVSYSVIQVSGFPQYWTETVTLANAIANIPSFPTGSPISVGDGRSMIVHDTAQAQYANLAPTIPKNGGPSSDLSLLALQIFTDYVRWSLVSYDRKYAGIVAHAADGYCDALTFTYRPDELSTQAVTLVPSDRIDEFTHSDTPYYPPLPINAFVYLTSGGVSALSGSSPSFTPGTGTGALYYDNGTNIVPTSSPTTTVLVRNQVPTAITGSKLIEVSLVTRYVGGVAFSVYYPTVVPC
jgi:hypothetical protein